MGISHCLKTGNSILQWVNNSALQGGSSLIEAPTVSYVSWNSQKSPGPFSSFFIVKCVLHKPVIKAQALRERFYIVWPMFWPTNAGRLTVNDHQLSFLRILNPQVSLLESPPQTYHYAPFRLFSSTNTGAYSRCLYNSMPQILLFLLITSR